MDVRNRDIRPVNYRVGEAVLLLEITLADHGKKMESLTRTSEKALEMARKSLLANVRVYT